jgi:hypothetical protein
VAVGGILAAMGAVWALQGAWILPATFMRGPAWILIGLGLAAVGVFLALIGWRPHSGALEGRLPR